MHINNDLKQTHIFLDEFILESLEALYSNSNMFTSLSCIDSRHCNNVIDDMVLHGQWLCCNSFGFDVLVSVI